jgi:N4-gp56 family major capsid protein
METQLATALEKQVWSTQYISEYIRRTRFKPFMGRSNDSIIIVKYELQTESGKIINIPLITRLKGKGVGGSAVLSGNEEAMGNYNCAVAIDWVRNGVDVPKSTSYKTEINLFEAAKPALRSWSMEDLRTDIIYALMQIITGGDATLPYSEITIDTVNGGYMLTGAAGVTFTRREGVDLLTATEAQKNVWMTNNSDRILFGEKRSNVAATHALSLANITTASSKLSTDAASLAKRMAGNADPHITPYQLEDGREFYVYFAGPRSFRDLKKDANMISANRDARPRNVEENPIFQDGDLIYDGIIFKEIKELPHIVNVGAGGNTDVEANFLCGKQALAVAWGQEPTPRQDMKKDYEFRPGVAIEELRGTKKLAFNNKQQGIVTHYTAGAADA